MTKYPTTFTDPQFAFLKRTAKKLGISIAEYVRRIVDAHMGKAIIVLMLALSAVACGELPTAPCQNTAQSRTSPNRITFPVGHPQEGQPMGNINGTRATVRPECR